MFVSVAREDEQVHDDGRLDGVSEVQFLSGRNEFRTGTGTGTGRRTPNSRWMCTVHSNTEMTSNDLNPSFSREIYQEKYDWGIPNVAFASFKRVATIAGDS